jgi:hypothetical protein
MFWGLAIGGHALSTAVARVRRKPRGEWHIATSDTTTDKEAFYVVMHRSRIISVTVFCAVPDGFAAEPGTVRSAWDRPIPLQERHFRSHRTPILPHLGSCVEPGEVLFTDFEGHSGACAVDVGFEEMT